MPGTYSVMIISTYTTNSGSVRADTIRSAPIVIEPSSEPCLVKVYTGVTPNNDNNNDTWFIQNIEMFPNNRVTLYSRWGVQVYEEKGYDNRTRVWPTADHLNNLTSSTYFYIIELGDGSRPLKGWVELLKN
jgi:gliding motility-associated-like protein